MVAKVRERLAVRKQAAQKSDGGRFNLRKLNEGEELSGSIKAGNFLTSGKVYWLASQEGLCSIE